MNKTLILALGIASTAVIVSAHAQTYQWKDASGRTVISDSLPPGVKGVRAIGAAQPSVVSEKPVEKTDAAPKSMAEKDQEFKKRQQEAREKADRAAKEQQFAREKQENCEQAKRNLAVLESARPMTTLNEKGEYVVIDDVQRAQEIERNRRIVAESCN